MFAAQNGFMLFLPCIRCEFRADSGIGQLFLLVVAVNGNNTSDYTGPLQITPQDLSLVGDARDSDCT